ncbi:MAG: hypothetical protein U0325_07895 [Polyangiales bacterium]
MRGTLLLLLVGVLTVACSQTNAGVAGADDASMTDLGASFDLPDLGATGIDAPDAPTPADAPRADLPTPAVDAPTLDAPGGCGRDEDCAGDPAGAVCNVSTRRCVACLPTRDGCPAGQYCGRENVCLAGCRDDAACGGAGGVDGGAGRAGRCEPVSRTCVECVVDDHCPAGTLCVGNVCAAGCTDTRGCPGAQQCCNGACSDPASSIAHCGGCGRVCAVPNAMPACQNGMCTVGACAAPFADCDRLPANGCEVDTLRDVAHCGGCNTRCADRPNAAVQCAAGRCADPPAPRLRRLRRRR